MLTLSLSRIDAEGLPTLDQAWEFVCDMDDGSESKTILLAQQIATTQWVHIPSGIPLRRINDLATLDHFVAPSCPTIQFGMEDVFTGPIRLSLQMPLAKKDIPFVSDLDLFYASTEIDVDALLRPLLKHAFDCKDTLHDPASWIVVGKFCQCPPCAKKDFSHLFNDHKFSFMNGIASVQMHHPSLVCK